MAKDKRLLICKSIIVHAQRLVSEKKAVTNNNSSNPANTKTYDVAEDVPIWMEFTVPPKLLSSSSGDSSTSTTKRQQQHDSSNNNNSSLSTSTFSIEDKTFLLPHSVVARTGRGSVLFIANDIAFDCAKINKKYNLFDAVISLDSIINDERLGPKKASIAASTFSRFIFDERVVNHPRLPRCLKQIALKMSPQQNHLTVQILKDLVDEKAGNQLIFTLKQSGQGTRVEVVDKQQQTRSAAISSSNNNSKEASSGVVVTSGAVRVRIGHCGMNAGAVTENGKEFLKSLRQDFPQVARAIQVVHLTTSITRPIQWMELQISR